MTLSLCERLDSRRMNQPARFAYIIDGVERDNKTSIDHVFRIANGLISAGIGKGDRIAVLSRNSVECAEVMTGILCSGASMVPVPNTAAPEAQRNMLLDSAVKGLFVSDQYRDAALECFMDIPSIRADLRFALETACEQFHDHVAWANTFDVSSPNVHMSPDEEYDILYSSGTTGIPKGIIHSHRARNLLISGTEKMAGKQWFWRIKPIKTENNNFLQVVVSVYSDEDDQESSIVSVTGLIDRYHRPL